MVTMYRAGARAILDQGAPGNNLPDNRQLQLDRVWSGYGRPNIIFFITARDTLRSGPNPQAPGGGIGFRFNGELFELMRHPGGDGEWTVTGTVVPGEVAHFADWGPIRFPGSGLGDPALTEAQARAAIAGTTADVGGGTAKLMAAAPPTAVFAAQAAVTDSGSVGARQNGTLAIQTTMPGEGAPFDLPDIGVELPLPNPDALPTMILASEETAASLPGLREAELVSGAAPQIEVLVGGDAPGAAGIMRVPAEMRAIQPAPATVESTTAEPTVLQSAITDALREQADTFRSAPGFSLRNRRRSVWIMTDGTVRTRKPGKTPRTGGPELAAEIEITLQGYLVSKTPAGNGGVLSPARLLDFGSTWELFDEEIELSPLAGVSGLSRQEKLGVVLRHAEPGDTFTITDRRGDGEIGIWLGQRRQGRQATLTPTHVGYDLKIVGERIQHLPVSAKDIPLYLGRDTAVNFGKQVFHVDGAELARRMNATARSIPSGGYLTVLDDYTTKVGLPGRKEKALAVFQRSRRGWKVGERPMVRVEGRAVQYTFPASSLPDGANVTVGDLATQLPTTTTRPSRRRQ